MLAAVLSACETPPEPAPAPPEDPPRAMEASRIDVVDLRRDGDLPFIEGRLDPTPAAAAAVALRDRFVASGAPGGVVFAIETARVRAAPVAASDSIAGVVGTRHDGLIRLRGTRQPPNGPTSEALIEATRRLDVPESFGPLQREQALNAFVADMVADLLRETEARLDEDGGWFSR
ncbi:MAG: hypothetical protein AAF684_04610 [Pseudomonadota bacterium]